MHDTTLIEDQQKDRYPGLRVRRDGDAVVVHIPMRLRRRNGRCMVLTEGEAAPVSAAKHVEDAADINRPLVEAIAKGHRWQAQLESASTPASKTWPRTSASHGEAAGRRRAVTV